MSRQNQRAGDNPAFVSASAVPSPELRECTLTWPGERAVLIEDLPEARAEGWEPVALVWHGERGSWREAWEKRGVQR